jgi:prepilin-type N-terminal cleavage/methylation domain-containing protein
MAKKKIKKRIKTSKLKELLSKIKGFTLVELLAVIVILAIIMVIAIPSVVNTSKSASKKSFLEFARKVSQEAERKYTEATTFGGLDLDLENELTFVVYTIEKDLGLKNVGDYKGIVMVGDAIDDHYNLVILYDKKYFVQNKFAGDDDYKDISLEDIVTRTTTENQFKQMVNKTVKLDSIDLKKVYAYVQARMNCGDSRNNVYDGETNNLLISYKMDDPNEIKQCYAYGENKSMVYAGIAIQAELNGTLDSILVSN